MYKISKIKAGIWFGSLLNVIFVPVIAVVYFFMHTANGLDNNASRGDMISAVIGGIIGYVVCIFLAYYLRKSEKEKCGNNPLHMKAFTKAGIKAYLVFLMFMTIFLIIPAIMWGCNSGSARKNYFPDTVVDESGNFCRVITDSSGNPRVCRSDGTTSPLRSNNGSYLDRDGKEYGTKDQGWSMYI